MFERKLSIDEWRQQIETLVLLVNRQYHQISESSIEVSWVDYSGGCEAVVRLPCRSQRIAFELLISEMLQGVCYVVDNTTLKWVYM